MYIYTHIERLYIYSHIYYPSKYSENKTVLLFPMVPVKSSEPKNFSVSLKKKELTNVREGFKTYC